MLHLGLRRNQRGGCCFREVRPRARCQSDSGGDPEAVRLSLFPFHFRSWPPAPRRELAVLQAAHIEEAGRVSGAHVELALVVASATSSGIPVGRAQENRCLIALAEVRIKAQFRQTLVKSSSSFLRSSRMQAGWIFFLPLSCRRPGCRRIWRRSD